MPAEHLTLPGAGALIGAAATPPRDSYVDMGRRAIDPDLATIARARAKEMRAAFDEGVICGAYGMLQHSASEKAEMWRFSDTLKLLAGGARGFDVIGVWAVCSDPRAKGRECWRVFGAWGRRAWIHAEGIDLFVEIGTLKRVVELTPLTMRHDGGGL